MCPLFILSSGKCTVTVSGEKGWFTGGNDHFTGENRHFTGERVTNKKTRTVKPLSMS
ncbi:hypothetical protein JYA63_07600 [Fictibacillus nanhaiensis]|uniref:Uncharacterized protein n=1 Tax=Fictibacillus nanhaiensis TaxID=742169 RepID=A0ABS2ZRV8_9BACL|nr:hypothetical protein [Fictibacillus nanhaiensis]